MELLVVLGIVTAVFLTWYGVRTYRPKPPPAALERPRPAALKGQGPRRVSAVDRASGAGSVEEMEAKQAYAKRGVKARKPVTEAWIDHALPEIDLRSLASRRLRIVGVANYLRDRERSLFGGVEYRLVREPENVYDANAVAVYGQERKVGYLSAAKAASLAPLLDRLGEAAFAVSGCGVTEASARLWVDLPRVPELRKFHQ